MCVCVFVKMCVKGGKGRWTACVHVYVFQKETGRFGVCAYERIVCVRSKPLYHASAQILQNCSGSAEVQTLIQVL